MTDWLLFSSKTVSFGGATEKLRSGVGSGTVKTIFVFYDLEIKLFTRRLSCCLVS